MILKIRKNRTNWAVYWLQGLDFFAQIRRVCSHFMLRKRSFSQSPPLKNADIAAFLPPRGVSGRGFKSI